MTCACESVHPFPCQFPAETEFFRITPEDDREWCRFHLPLQDGKGNQSDKGRGENGWEEGGPELEKFTVEVHARIRAAKKSDNYFFDDTRADFRGVVFPSYYNFTDITDVLHVDFERAVFDGEANFMGVTFGNGASFVGTTFSGAARFDSAIFGDRARFNGTTFGGVANFTSATFGDGASFDSATFRDWAIFISATFRAGASFDSAIFTYWARFYSATFSGGASFDSATFGDWADFDSATFGDKANFTSATFGEEARFLSATFGNGVSFNGVIFQGDGDFSAGTKMEANFDFKHIDFGDATFTGHCNFENRAFTASANFNGAVFHDLVEFHGCIFHAGMSFHQTRFLKTKGEDDDETEELERSYRTLKLEMEKLRARNEEADFFALEMECRRQRGSVPPFERFAATAYKHLSDYGRSIARPLVWMGFLLGYGFAYFYHLAQAKSCSAPGDVLRFVMEQVVTPFSIWSNRYVPDPWMAYYLKEQPLLLRAPATLITLMAITLIALFLLALRRRFKMD